MRLPLFILTVVLAAALGIEWLGWPPEPSQRTGNNGQAPHSDQETKQPNNPMRLLVPLEDKEQYAVIMERPLFLPDRRPPEDEPEEPETKTPLPDPDLTGLKLTAVLITPLVRTAWVQDPKEKDLVEVRPGDSLGGWAVKQVLSDRLLLERQGQTDTLILRDYKNAPPTQARAPHAGRSPSGRAHRQSVQPRSGAGNPRTSSHANRFRR